LALLVIAVSQLMVLLDVEAVCEYRREVPQAWTAAGFCRVLHLMQVLIN
jgi:hypothetical protein